MTRETFLEDDKAKTMEAIKVFSSAVGYLKDHMLTTCKKQLTNIEQSDIMWVLTIPAIWTDSSKQFMREAAEKVDFFIFFYNSRLFIYPYQRQSTYLHIYEARIKNNSLKVFVIVEHVFETNDNSLFHK